MQVDAIAVELRPRPMWEASDLGVRLVQAHARSLWRTWLPLYLVFALLALATVEVSPWLPPVLIFWLKPWLDRSILFVLSRAVFGQATGFADLWAAKGSVWGGQLITTLLWRRFSPWRAFTQPIYQLEGQRGTARRQRRKQLLRQQRGAALGMQIAFSCITTSLTFGTLALALWFAPEELRGDVLNWMAGRGQDDSVLASLCTAGVYAAVVALLEPFYVAAGFAMYLNRRVQLEAWDIEQEFRRAF
ncbi:hypothetical protein [Piscinibacter sp. HJYY11]|uniref:hypothetical protein n=1 Tax=Piscinibacter sp. HJYY11 TaxID=2801333 RepID=UPI00191D5B06|nr:hypothetical protein [Piscinibacter sp. HJYY11]MBL0729331.1 hypothetical protein [Piscinibacter sp. HJYY11]